MGDKPAAEHFGIDLFPVGCLATDGSRIIGFANAHAAAQVDRPRRDLLGMKLEDLLTPASRIFCDSYVYPILLKEGHCEEISLNLATGSDGSVSVVANVRIHDDDPELVLWSFMSAHKRNRLQTEVLTARNQLQKQARSLKELALRDDLTGLLNRRGFTRMITPLISASDRSGASVMVFLLDIDKFKAVNDMYGHQTGDDVLRQLGVSCNQMVRTHEIAGRFGGEEFIFAIASEDVEAARPFNRRLHAAAASVTGRGAPVTVSIGLFFRPPGSGQSFEDAVKAADRALYRAKELGRNRSMLETGGSVVPFD